MASQARRLSNHYEVLGLSPAASQSEIALAFERAMSNFARPLSTTVELYQAFEVLRDPDKRRAYDRSIGLAPEAAQPQFLIRSRDGAFTVAARASSKIEPVMPAANDRSRNVAPVPAPQPQPAPVPRIEAARPPLKPVPTQREPHVVSADTLRPAPPIQIAETLPPAAPVESQVIAPAPEPAVEPAEPFVLPKGRKPTDERDLDQLVESILAEGHAEKAALRNAERRRRDWRGIGISAAALMVGAGILGGLVGVWGSEPIPADNAVDVALPSPSPYLEGTAPSAELDVESESQLGAENEARERRRLGASLSERRINPLVIPPEVSEAPPETVVPAAEPPSENEPAATPTVDPLAPQPEESGASGESAQLPLPNATVARTIQKIGYPCGSVSSVASAGGGGVFKVTCSGGQSYRAAPTGGRYRFKKWAGA